MAKGRMTQPRRDTSTRTNKGSTQDQTKHNANHKTTRGVITKWEDNPFTHKTKVYQQGEREPFYT